MGHEVWASAAAKTRRREVSATSRAFLATYAIICEVEPSAAGTGK